MSLPGMGTCTPSPAGERQAEDASRVVGDDGFVKAHVVAPQPDRLPWGRRQGAGSAVRRGADKPDCFPAGGGLIAAPGRGLPGYRPTRPAEDIRLLDIVEAVGGSVRLELPRVPIKGGDELHRRLQAADDAV